jgi:hypothetical protein
VFQHPNQTCRKICIGRCTVETYESTPRCVMRIGWRILFLDDLDSFNSLLSCCFSFLLICTSSTYILIRLEGTVHSELGPWAHDLLSSTQTGHTLCVVVAHVEAKLKAVICSQSHETQSHDSVYHWKRLCAYNAGHQGLNMVMHCYAWSWATKSTW